MKQNTYKTCFLRKGMKKGNDKLTVSLNGRIKELYKDYCDKKGLKIGKQIEIFMEQELKKVGLLK